MSQVIGIFGAVAAAVIAYALGLRRDRRQKLREEQIRSATDFCRLLMEYSGAQLRRRTEEIRRTSKAAEDEAIAQAVRTTRANVWSSYFHVMLVVDDPEAIQLARAALDSAVSIKRAGEGLAPGEAYEESKRVAEQVRDEAEKFIRQVAQRLGIRSTPIADTERGAFS